MDEIDAAKLATQDVYERQARHWDSIRVRNLYEKPWLDRFAASIPAQSNLLDLGCGAGDPVAKYFIDMGHHITGTDYSKTMIELARNRFSKQIWIEQDIRNLDIAAKFHGIYSWDGFFHLSAKEQRALLPKLAEITLEGGAMLLTVGTGEGEVLGTVGGETVYHASLSPDEYKSILSDCGFADITYVAEDPDCLGRSVVLASHKRR